MVYTQGRFRPDGSVDKHHSDHHEDAKDRQGHVRSSMVYTQGRIRPKGSVDNHHSDHRGYPLVMKM